MLRLEEEFNQLISDVGPLVQQGLKALLVTYKKSRVYLSYYEYILNEWHCLFVINTSNNPISEVNPDSSDLKDTRPLYRYDRSHFVMENLFSKKPIGLLRFHLKIPETELSDDIETQIIMAQKIINSFFAKAINTFENWKNKHRSRYPDYSFPSDMKQVLNKLSPLRPPAIITLMAPEQEDRFLMYDILRIKWGFQFQSNLLKNTIIDTINDKFVIDMNNPYISVGTGSPESIQKQIDVYLKTHPPPTYSRF